MQRGGGAGSSAVAPWAAPAVVTGLTVGECRGQMSTGLPRAVLCSCGSTSWLCIAQRHRGSPSTKASSLQNTRLRKLHFPHLSSVSSKLQIFLSCNIHVWSSHSNGEAQWHITLFVHCQSYHVTYSNIFHLESRFSFSFASHCIVLFLPLLPCALPC